MTFRDIYVTTHEQSEYRYQILEMEFKFNFTFEEFPWVVPTGYAPNKINWKHTAIILGKYLMLSYLCEKLAYP